MKTRAKITILYLDTFELLCNNNIQVYNNIK